MTAALPALAPSASLEAPPAPSTPASAARYAQLAAVLLLGGLVLRHSAWTSSGELHIVLEAMSTVTALVVGILAIARYRSHADPVYLFLATGFVGTAVLDGYHAFMSSAYALASSESPASALVPWTWITSRYLLGLLLFLSAFGFGPALGSRLSVGRGRAMVAAVTFLTAACFVFFLLVPVRPAYVPGALVPRPADLGPAVLFLATFGVFYRRVPWRTNVVAHWLMVALLLSAASELYASFSTGLYDALFDGAHVLKLVSYFAVFAGFATDLAALYRRSDRAARALSAANTALLEQIRSRQAAEQAVRKHERELADAQALAHTGSWDWNVPADEVAWSDEMYRIYGYEPGSLDVDFGIFLSRLPDDEVTRVEGIIQSAMRDGESVSFHHRIVRADDGAERIIDARANVEMGSDGQPVRLWGTGQDVTGQREAEEALRASEVRFRALAETAQDAIISIDGSGLITFWNSAATRIFGYTDEEIVGMEANLLVDRDAAPVSEMPAMGEMTCVRKGGEAFPVEYSLGTWQSGEGAFFTVIVRDISERTRARLELQQSAAELAVSNRELEEFAYIASHDLQAPLRKVMVLGDRLRGHLPDDTDATALDYLDRALAAAARMQRLIDDLLDLSRVSNRDRDPVPVDLNDVVHQVIDDLEVGIAQTDATIDVEDLPVVLGDASQLAQLLQNLLGNALKFARPGVPPRVRISAGATGGPLTAVKVTDNGIGFDQRYAEKIFQPFQRLRPRHEYAGTGMGLAICRRIVERHHGTLSALSKPGEGSTFVVELPSAHEGAAAG
jgi:PAS domain S-box-containing protein